MPTNQPTASALEGVLLALLPGLAKLIETALNDQYDQEAERDALFKMQRAAAQLRLDRMLASRK